MSQKRVSEKSAELHQEVSLLEFKLQQAETEVKTQAVIIDRMRSSSDERMLLVRLDGSIEERPLCAGRDGGPMPYYDRVRMERMDDAYSVSALSAPWERPRPFTRERFRLLGKVGAKYVYGEV